MERKPPPAVLQQMTAWAASECFPSPTTPQRLTQQPTGTLTLKNSRYKVVPAILWRVSFHDT
eukprot:scaffold160613_cov26-Attheya_sp.AAC.1